MPQVLMPALSPTMEEGNLAKWVKKEGDKIVSGDVIAEIETDKATMEVEAVDEGVLTQILIPAGTEGVKVNTPIAFIQGEGEEAAAPAASAATKPTAAASQKERMKSCNAQAKDKSLKGLAAYHASRPPHSEGLAVFIAA